MIYQDQFICPETFPWRYANIVATDTYVEEIMFSDIQLTRKSNSLTERCMQQLHLYFFKKLTIFDIPFSQPCRSFADRVHHLLMDIPYGETRTYKAMACTLGSPKNSRAVGHACSVNKLSIVIPCHRVISSSGKLTGYSGGLSTKEWLLKFESGKRSL